MDYSSPIVIVLILIFSNTAELLLTESDRNSNIYFGQTAGVLTYEKFGTEAKLKNNGEHPYIAALEFKGSHVCGSAIIDKDVVITAAHCVRDKAPKDLQVRAGSFLIGDTNTAMVQIRNIYKIISHENVKFETPIPWDFDIALLLLHKKFKLNEYVNVIQLADIDLRNSAYGESVTLLGWGLTEISYKSRDLLKANALLLSHSKCQQKALTHEKITRNMVCTLSKDKVGICRGDSGGPLIIRKGGDDKLVGIMSSAVTYSYNKRCDTTYPSVYGDVAALQPWIVQKLVKIIPKMRKERDSWLKRIPFIKV